MLLLLASERKESREVKRSNNAASHVLFVLSILSYHMGAELLRADPLNGDTVLKNLWLHQDAILCCSLNV